MKLISIFKRNGNTYVKDDAGNVYELKLVKDPSLLLPPPVIPDTCDDIELRNEIIKMLQELKVPPHSTAYNFLIDCLYFSIKYDQCRTNLSKNLYPKVAKLHNLKVGSIASSFSPIIITWKRTKQYEHLFDKKCVGAKRLILGLTDYFLNQYKMES